MRLKALALSLLVAAPVMANHPGENLNEVMAAKEAAFEPVAPRRVPDAKWKDNIGGAAGLDQLQGKIAAISFVPAGCGTACADQQAKLAETLSSLNAGPMREMVEFVTLSDGQVTPSGEFANWMKAQMAEGKSVSDLAAAFATGSSRTGAAPMIHLLDRKGQQIGIFHGSNFRPLNLVLYINGLTNAHSPPEPGLFERLFGWLS